MWSSEAEINSLLSTVSPYCPLENTEEEEEGYLRTYKADRLDDQDNGPPAHCLLNETASGVLNIEWYICFRNARALQIHCTNPSVIAKDFVDHATILARSALQVRLLFRFNHWEVRALHFSITQPLLVHQRDVFNTAEHFFLEHINSCSNQRFEYHRPQVLWMSGLHSSFW